MDTLAWFIMGLVLGAAGCAAYCWLLIRHYQRARAASVAGLLAAHFRPLALGDITIAERQFPFRVRAELQRTIDQLFGGDYRVLHFRGVRRGFNHYGIKLSDCTIENQQYPVEATPPEFEEINIGEDQPIPALKSGLWLLESAGVQLAVLMVPSIGLGGTPGMEFQVGTPNNPEGAKVAKAFFKQLERSALNANSYRGKILSLESAEQSYSGQSSGITVHKLRPVERDQVILPESTLRLLERNVIQFVKQRERLSQYGQATKKGLLFYGPPGTGKTHTIHYLARALEGHTTLLISAEQVALLGEYMTLARLLQPSMVVLEDVDLIARDRNDMSSPCEEVLLNKLLNEMDGLKEQADILFVLTTNRPESLEAALASRPGRVDQAIEFPLPDEPGRAKLVRLYAGNTALADDLVAEIVRRSEGVSAAFIKELMRRIIQFHIERNGGSPIDRTDVDSALEEMLFSGGSLNLKLLGAGQIENRLQCSTN